MMETKNSQNVSGSNLANIPMSEDGVVYIAIKGSLYANDCSIFGLGQEELNALTKKYPGSGTVVLNGVAMKVHVIQLINSMSQLGYKVVSSTGEAEITWTLQRDV